MAHVVVPRGWNNLPRCTRRVSQRGTSFLAPHPHEHVLVYLNVLAVQLFIPGSSWSTKRSHTDVWLERAGVSVEGSQGREGAISSLSLIAMPCSVQMSWTVVLFAEGDNSLLMQFQYGCSVAPPTFVVLKLNIFVYKSLKCIAKTYVLAVIADVNLFVILQRLGEVFHKYVRGSIKILWQAARVENSTVTSQQGTSTLTHNSLVIDGISVPCSILEMR